MTNTWFPTIGDPTSPLLLILLISIDFPDASQGKKGEAKKGEAVGASVDFATWTEQVRQRCHFDAGAISRGLTRQGSKDLNERQDPQDMCCWSMVNLRIGNAREIMKLQLPN